MAYYTLGIIAIIMCTKGMAQADSMSMCSLVRCNDGDFDYDLTSRIGPAYWGNLNENCRSGKTQSPFNVLVNYDQTGKNEPVPVVKAKRAVVQFQPTSNNFKFKCSTEFGHCSSVTVQQRTYSLKQVHFHSPSEHHIGGIQYPLELHFVHQTPTTSQVPVNALGATLAVVSIMFEVGQPNGELQSLLDAAQKRDYAVVDLSRIVSAAIADTCVFEGSLTTPPCAEGVKWIMSLGRLTASLQQIGEYRAMVGEKNTNRPLQPANGRPVVCYARNKKVGPVIPGIM